MSVNLAIVCSVRSPKPEDTNSSSKCGARYFEPAQSVRMTTPVATCFVFIVSDSVTLFAVGYCLGPFGIGGTE